MGRSTVRRTYSNWYDKKIGGKEPREVCLYTVVYRESYVVHTVHYDTVQHSVQTQCRPIYHTVSTSSPRDERDVASYSKSCASRERTLFIRGTKFRSQEPLFGRKTML